MNTVSTNQGLNIESGELSKMASAAEVGDNDAAMRLSNYYDVFERNQTKRMYWLRVAAQRGYAPAQHSLGVLMLRDANTIDEKQIAIEWLRKAAAQKFELSVQRIKALER